MKGRSPVRAKAPQRGGFEPVDRDGNHDVAAEQGFGNVVNPCAGPSMRPTAAIAADQPATMLARAASVATDATIDRD